MVRLVGLDGQRIDVHRTQDPESGSFQPDRQSAATAEQVDGRGLAVTVWTESSASFRLAFHRKNLLLFE
jgi:hypothetical protein